MSPLFLAALASATPTSLVCNAVDDQARVSSFALEVAEESGKPVLRVSGFGPTKENFAAGRVSNDPEFFGTEIAGKKRFLTLNDGWLRRQFAVLEIALDSAGERGPVELMAICGAAKRVKPIESSQEQQPSGSCVAVDVDGRRSQFSLRSDGPGKPQMFAPADGRIWDAQPFETKVSFMPKVEQKSVTNYLKSSDPVAGAHGPDVISNLVIEKDSRSASETAIFSEWSNDLVQSAGVAHCGQFQVPESSGL